MLYVSYSCRFHLNLYDLNVYEFMYTNMARSGGENDVMMMEAMPVRLYINNIYIYAIRIL